MLSIQRMSVSRWLDSFQTAPSIAAIEESRAAYSLAQDAGHNQLESPDSRSCQLEEMAS
jgi:hypothetical protein